MTDNCFILGFKIGVGIAMALLALMISYKQGYVDGLAKALQIMETRTANQNSGQIQSHPATTPE